MKNIMDEIMREVKKAAKRLAKKIVALVVMTALIGTGVIPTGATLMTSYAFEIKNDAKGGQESSCANTIYKWLSTGIIDFKGKKSNSSTYGSDSFKITFNNYGFKIECVVGREVATTEASTRGDSRDANQQFGSDASSANGNVIYLKDQYGTQTAIEGKVTVFPSTDNEYLLMDFDLFNTSNTSTLVSIRMFADTQLDSNDSCRIFVVPEGLHAVDDNSGSSTTMRSFDIVNDDTGLNLGVTPFNHMWAGHYNRSQNAGNSWCDPRSDYSINGEDSEMSYGWRNINVRGYEKVKKRIAFQMRNATYYVSSTGYDTQAEYNTHLGGGGAYKSNIQLGSIDKPFKTIGAALNAAKAKKKAYIYVQDSNVQLTSFNVDSADYDITISSSDYLWNGTYVTKNSNTFMVKTAADTTINVSAGKLTFTNIGIDSNNYTRTTPLINETSTGKVTFGGRSIFKNLKVDSDASADVPAVLKAAGSGTIEFLGTTVNNNRSGKNTAAIEIGSSITANIQSVNNIKNNDALAPDSTTTYKPANLMLCGTNKLKVTNQLREGNNKSSIGITLKTNPDPHFGDDAYTSSQEKVIAEAQSGSGYDSTGECAYVEFFTADEKDTGGTSIVKGVVGTNNRYPCMHKDGSKVYFEIVDEYGMNITNPTGGGLVSRPAQTKSVGESLSIDKPTIGDGTEEIAYLNQMYDLTSVTSSYAQLSIDNDQESPTYGKVTGKMPNAEVTITYTYTAKKGRIIFKSRGSNMSVDDFTGDIGMPVQGVLPSPTKRGYIFDNWCSDPGLTADVTALPDVYAIDPITYYAKYHPDPNFYSAMNVKYVNTDETINFGGPGVGQYNAEAAINYEAPTIPGYTFNQVTSKTNPTTYIFSGSDDPVNLHDYMTATGFSGMMPGDNLDVTFVYDISTETFPFTVKHIRNTDNSVVAEDTQNLIVNSEISASPLTTSGYTVTSNVMTEGGTAVPSQYKLAATGVWNNSAKTYTGFMPNQAVTIEYHYDTAETSSLLTTYEDHDSNDSAFKTIADFDLMSASIGQHLEKTPSVLYGYDFSETHTTVDPSATMTYQSGDNKYTGNAIDGAINLKINYTRQTDHFKQINYKIPQDPQIIENDAYTMTNTGASPDLLTSPSPYAAKVLAKDGSADGDTYAWKWSKIRNGHLLPTITILDTEGYYTFNSEWFIDTDDNGLYDSAVDVLLTDNYQFDDASTAVNVVPIIGKNPSKWVTATFDVDGYGTLTGQPLTNQFKYTDTWNDIQSFVPTPTADYGSEFVAWYKNGALVQNTEYMAAATYKAKFNIKNYNNIKKPNARGYLDDTANARISISDGGIQYNYVVAKEDGTIVTKKQGATTVNFTASDGLIINNKYNVYETTDDINSITIDTNVTSLSVKSDPKNIYIPAILDNYAVTFDTSDYTAGANNIAKLNINPTVSGVEYALYDGSGVVSGCEFTAGGGNIEFTGLVPGNSYKVVTKIGATEYTTTGSVVYIDNVGSNVENYTLAVLGGVINGSADSIMTIASGDNVTINYYGTDFDSWDVLYGNISVPNNAEATFSMPASNVIIRLITNKTYHMHKQNLAQETVGEAGYNIAGDISIDDNILSQVVSSNQAEDYLINHGFDIGYKVRYEKSDVTLNDENIVKSALDSTAGRVAGAINVDVNRYVQGYRLDPNNTFSDYDSGVYPLGNPLLLGALADINPLLAGVTFNEDGTYEIDENIAEYISTPSDIEEVEEEIQDGDTIVDNEEVAYEGDVDVEEEIVAPSDDTEIGNQEEVYEDEPEIDEENAVEEDDNEENISDDDEDEAVENDAGAEAVIEDMEDIDDVEVAENEQSEDIVVEDVEDDAEDGQTPENDEVVEDDEEIVGFNGTVEDENTELINTIDNLILLGSTYIGDVSIPTVVELPMEDRGMQDYQVYEDGSPITADVSNAVNGIIKFDAKNGKRYVIGYNKVVTLTFLNDSLNNNMVNSTQKYTRMLGEQIDFSNGLIEQLPVDYYDGMAHYDNGKWTYKRGVLTTEVQDADPAVANMTIYATYTTNADAVNDIIRQFNDIYEKVRLLVEYNRFLTQDEYDVLRDAYLVAKAVKETPLDPDNPGTYVSAIQGAIPPLTSAYNTAKALIDPRQEEYDHSNASATTDNGSGSTSGSRRSGGGGGGGGGGGAGGGTSNGTRKNNTDLMPIDNPNANAKSVINGNNVNTHERIDGEIVFTNKDGSAIQNVWVQQNDGSFYHVNGFGVADRGWFFDNNKWYHAGKEGLNKGKMDIGWLQDIDAGSYLPRFYYLGADGAMGTGWQQIEGQYYYFCEVDTVGHPLGSLMADTITPDGYMTDGFGRLVGVAGGVQ